MATLLSSDDGIRADFILQNSFSHMLKKHYMFDAIPAINDREKECFEIFKCVLESFKVKSNNAMKEVCLEIEKLEHFEIILQSVFNELFSQGISWGKILAFIDFVGELGIKCISRPPASVMALYECFDSFMKEKLQVWIQNNGGWMELNIFYDPLSSSLYWRRFLKNIIKVLSFMVEFNNVYYS